MSDARAILARVVLSRDAGAALDAFEADSVLAGKVGFPKGGNRRGAIRWSGPWAPWIDPKFRKEIEGTHALRLARVSVRQTISDEDYEEACRQYWKEDFEDYFRELVEEPD